MILKELAQIREALDESRFLLVKLHNNENLSYKGSREIKCFLPKLNDAIGLLLDPNEE